jgi:ssDNA-binding Zn-finger/Zn-ribbon topoisomerase 1
MSLPIDTYVNIIPLGAITKDPRDGLTEYFRGKCPECGARQWVYQGKEGSKWDCEGFNNHDSSCGESFGIEEYHKKCLKHRI